MMSILLQPGDLLHARALVIDRNDGKHSASSTILTTCKRHNENKLFLIRREMVHPKEGLIES